MSSDRDVHPPPRRPESAPEAWSHRTRELIAGADLAAARQYLERTDARTVAEQIELTEIPAPPFGEGARGDRMAALMRESGFEGVARDAVGNVLGHLAGPERPLLVVAAHLDTVFPTGTDVSVRRADRRLIGPGIGDNGRGLAALLALGRVLSATPVELSHPLLAVATVGEEGPGNLRGVRHLFRDGGPARHAAAFVSLDGAGQVRIVHRALGSQRFRVTLRGPGGHSWTDRGTPSPIHALGSAIHTLVSAGARPGVTLNVGTIGGGTSVNSIAEEAWCELEVRTEDRAELDRAVRDVRRAFSSTVDRVGAADAADGRGLESELEDLGHRPSGHTPADAPLVRAAVAATRALGTEPELVAASTDSNVPMALGLPAITLGAGGESGRAHTLDEWYRNRGGPAGILRAVLALMLWDAGAPPPIQSPER